MVNVHSSSIPFIVAKVPQALQFFAFVINHETGEEFISFNFYREIKWKDSFVGKRCHFLLFFEILDSKLF